MTDTLGIGLMCKPPRVGVSKTRLAARIGAEPAARLARAFLEDTAAMLKAAGAARGAALRAFYRPADADAEMAALLGADWPCVLCDAGDLGASMWMALHHMMAEGMTGAMLVGSDVPTLPQAIVETACAALRAGGGDDVVIGPGTDGGYYLIGIRSARAAPLFAPLRWSTPHVLPDTLARAEEHGLRVQLLPPWRDIDEAEDLAWLMRTLAEAGPQAPATRAALAALAPLPLP